MKFTWDSRKEATNLAKHGVPFSEAQHAFSDPLAIVAFDEAHSPRGRQELRWWLLGRVGGCVMLVRYTHRSNGVIRIIGAGYWEIGTKIYEGKIESTEKPKFNSAGYQVNMKDLNGEPLPDFSKLKFRPFKHGGARIGAGRKSSGRKAVLLRLSPKVISALRKEAERNHKTLSDVAEERLAHA